MTRRGRGIIYSSMVFTGCPRLATPGHRVEGASQKKVLPKTNKIQAARLTRGSLADEPLRFF